jgi:hypothetical protein
MPKSTLHIARLAASIDDELQRKDMQDPHERAQPKADHR